MRASSYSLYIAKRLSRYTLSPNAILNDTPKRLYCDANPAQGLSTLSPNAAVCHLLAIRVLVARKPAIKALRIRRTPIDDLAEARGLPIRVRFGVGPWTTTVALHIRVPIEEVDVCAVLSRCVLKLQLGTKVAGALYLQIVGKALQVARVAVVGQVALSWRKFLVLPVTELDVLDRRIAVAREFDAALVKLRVGSVSQFILVVVAIAVVVTAKLAGCPRLLRELELHAVGTADTPRVWVWLTKLEFSLISTSDVKVHVEEVVADHTVACYNATQLATDVLILVSYHAA